MLSVSWWETHFRPWTQCILQRESMNQIHPCSRRSSMLFLTLMCLRPAPVRNKPTFSHRLCIRVAANAEKKTLSITDLGSGMTRADIINGLGIGHLSHRALQASKRLGTTVPSLEKDESQDNDDVSTTSEDAEQREADDEAEAEITDDSSADDEEEVTDEHEDDDGTGAVPCRASDIGGFYSALCSLGIGVAVGTKVNFICLTCAPPE
jgi:hypothetical protein